MEDFKFNTIEEAVADLRAGKIIIVTDDPDRENEGDLICAAEFATLENVNFMASYAKGLICMPKPGQALQVERPKLVTFIFCGQYVVRRHHHPPNQGRCTPIAAALGFE